MNRASAQLRIPSKRGGALQVSQEIPRVNPLAIEPENGIHRTDESALRRDPNRPLIQVNRRVGEIARLDHLVARDIPAENLLLEVFATGNEPSMLSYGVHRQPRFPTSPAPRRADQFSQRNHLHDRIAFSSSIPCAISASRASMSAMISSGARCSTSSWTTSL